MSSTHVLALRVEAAIVEVRSSPWCPCHVNSANYISVEASKYSSLAPILSASMHNILQIQY